MVNSIASRAAENTQITSLRAPRITSGSGGSDTTSGVVADSVKLSAVAQAHAMQQQGMAVHSIAASMGVNTQTVDGYLGISSGTTSGGGGRGTAEIEKIAARVRVNPPANGES